MSTRANPAASPMSAPQPGGFWRRFRHDGFQSTALYRLTLRGPAPKGVKFSVPELWPGDPQQGRALIGGQFTFQGETHALANDGHIPEQATPEWRAWYHGHSWLKDVRALGGNDAPNFVRERLSAWIDAHADTTPIAWRKDVVGERLIQWCQNWSLLAGDKHDPLTKKLRHLAGRDARHLLRAAPGKKTGYARFLAIKGQVFAAVALLGGDGRSIKG